MGFFLNRAPDSCFKRFLTLPVILRNLTGVSSLPSMTSSITGLVSMLSNPDLHAAR